MDNLKRKNYGKSKKVLASEAIGGHLLGDGKISESGGDKVHFGNKKKLPMLKKGLRVIYLLTSDLAAKQDNCEESRKRQPFGG